MTAKAEFKADGSITAWGIDHGGVGAPSTGVYTQIYSNSGAFAALKADGSIEPSALTATKALKFE
jgi:hypothetical protein